MCIESIDEVSNTDFTHLSENKSIFSTFFVIAIFLLFLIHRQPYQDYIGGIALVNAETFLKMNGFSNMYFGWGAEDDDFFFRFVHFLDFEKKYQYLPILHRRSVTC